MFTKSDHDLLERVARTIVLAMNALPSGKSRASGSEPFDSLAQEAYLNLWRTYDRLKAHEDELFGRYDLSAQQYNALRLLRGVHPETVPTLNLGTRLISRAPDMTRLLDKLEERGLIWRERRNENRRVVQVGITAAGLQLLDELAAEVDACHQKQLGHLGPKTLQQLIDILRKVREPHEGEVGIWSASRNRPRTRKS